MTRVSVPRGRDGLSSNAPGSIPSFDDDTIETKRPASPAADLDDTVSELPVQVLLPPEVPELTPAGPGMEPPTERQFARIPAAPELTPKTLDRRHPKYGGQLMDAARSEITDVIPDREQALDLLIAQRSRLRSSEADAHAGKATGERASGQPEPRDRGSMGARGQSSDAGTIGMPAAVSARAQAGLLPPMELESPRSTFITSMVVGMALVIVGAVTAVLALPLLPARYVNNLVPRPSLELAAASPGAPARTGAAPGAAPTSSAAPLPGALVARAAEGDRKAMAILGGKPRSDLSAAELVALSSGGLQHRRAELVKTREELATRERQPSPELLRRVLTDAREPALAEDALLTLAQWPSPQGYDALWELAARTREHDRIRLLARELLSTREAAARLSPALKVAVDLGRLAPLAEQPGTCQQLAEVVARARDSGDVRSLTLLGALTARRGCGPRKTADCFQCLRANPTLEQAIRAVGRRPAPPLP